ncbi:MAG: lycopene cyclase domain-containing protein [Candidatus Nanopelagicaceae bacterium]|jgi:lycopene cyclase domain-containing protein|nr:lycopene cyclase domain-containing protein [Actinomycetota bacterium]NCV43676.1 lycopene cyclase domain-containing protein [Actinomycetota bacterium]NCV83160.1 lycopene cyclase domain-containing protein [Actinomycetota bacterium]NCV95639.1 lycopene cyclase domain-containing protein [Actinomycetota bacterium]NCW46760.1 lycopene cyclase domain-containing protein [Actinomycetota bacterium]
MSYTELSILSVILVILIDRYILKSRLLEKKAYWTAYAIIIFFQLLTNWWLTSRNILSYSEAAIIGWRIASAPVEDLLFGFSMVTLTMSLWIFWGRKGVERD